MVCYHLATALASVEVRGKHKYKGTASSVSTYPLLWPVRMGIVIACLAPPPSCDIVVVLLPLMFVQVDGNVIMTSS